MKNITFKVLFKKYGMVLEFNNPSMDTEYDTLSFDLTTNTTRRYSHFDGMSYIPDGEFEIIGVTITE